MGILFTNRKLPTIHSESLPGRRSITSTYSYSEKWKKKKRYHFQNSFDEKTTWLLKVHVVCKINGVQRRIEHHFSCIVVASALIYAFLKFFVQALRTIFLESHWLLSHKIIFETMDKGESGMTPVAMCLINPRGFKNIGGAGDRLID